MPECLHENFYTSAMIGRGVAKEGGPVIAFTAAFTLKCSDCDQPFYFGHYLRVQDSSRQQIEIPCAPGTAPMEAPWVPGQFECPKCMFRLSSMKLHASSGAVAQDRDSKPEQCPNDGEIMKRVTWQQQCDDLGAACERYAARVCQLEDAWPSGFEMPVE